MLLDIWQKLTSAVLPVNRKLASSFKTFHNQKEIRYILAKFNLLMSAYTRVILIRDGLIIVNFIAIFCDAVIFKKPK